MEEEGIKNEGRGYYSEVIINENEIIDQLPGAFKRTKLLWQIRTENHSPIIQNINISTRHSFLAPATRWTTFPDEKRIVRSSTHINLH